MAADRPRRGWAGSPRTVVLVLSVVLLVCGCSPPSIHGRPTAGSSAPTPMTGWLSGAAGEGVADGAFAAWRRTRCRSPEPGPTRPARSRVPCRSWLRAGVRRLERIPGSGRRGDLRGRGRNLGGRGRRRLRPTLVERTLTDLSSLWSAQPRGTLYLRFAHEWNGSWSPWTVRPDEIADFITAWRRFSAIKAAVMPQAGSARANGDTSGFTYDWREGWPGDDAVDVYATDWYSDLLTGSVGVDAAGGPVGLEAHCQFAADHEAVRLGRMGQPLQRDRRPARLHRLHPPVRRPSRGQWARSAALRHLLQRHRVAQ